MNHKSTTAYPLTWPDGRVRTVTRVQSRFGECTVAKALSALKEELQRLGARYIVISTNIPLKDNGDPYSDPGRMKDPGCAVYFQLSEKPYCLPCDRWNVVEDNMYAIAKHIEAMRGMERWGVGSVEQTFAGFKQLTADAESWWDVLECRRDADVETISNQYRARAKSAHSDTGGTDAAMARLNVARDQALEERGRA